MRDNPRGRRLADNCYRGSNFQRLLWHIFIYEHRYSKDELAVYLGKAPDTILAYCEGELRLHIDLVPKILAFVAGRDPGDTELLDYFLKPAGRVSVREAEARGSLNGERRGLLLKHSILTGQAQSEIEQAYSDGRLEKSERNRILRVLREQKELVAELEKKMEGDVR